MSSAPATSDLVSLTIDGVPLQVRKGTLLVEAAKMVKQEIPVYCYHTKLGPAGLYRVCLVEVEGTPKLQIGCNTPVAEGMVVRTRGESVEKGRAMVLELLLVNHPLDCPICDKGGECDLQDYAISYGRGSSDLADPKTSKPKAVDLGPTIVLDEERCVVCQRCVRFDDLIAGERQLVLKDRGHRDMIATATGEPYRHNFTGNVTELCPVGALTSKTYRFKSRPWDLQRTETSCTQCAVGCRMNVDVRHGNILRTMSVEGDDAVSDWWLCDRGRYNIGYIDSPERIKQPLLRRDGTFVQIGWDDAFALWAKAIRSALEAGGPERVAAIGGGRLTNEEAYLLARTMRSLGVKNLDWRAGRQRQATPGSAGGTLLDLERAGAIVTIGESPAELAPVMDLRVRKAVRHGARLIRVAAHEAPPSMPFQDVADVAAAAAAIPANVTRVALLWDGVDSALARAAFAALDREGRTLLTYIAGEQGNARGAEAMGMLPFAGPGYHVADTGRDFEAICNAALAGDIETLAMFGANPVRNAADGARVREALQAVPFLVVTELFMTETARLASLVLPAAGAFEKSGSMVNLAGDVLPTAAALAPPDGVLSDFEIVAGLARALEIELPDSDEIERATIAAAAALPVGIAYGDERFAGAAKKDLAGEGLRAHVLHHAFVGGGTLAHDERIAALQPVPTAAFAAADADRLGIRAGDRVDIVGSGGTIGDLLAERRDTLAPGNVALLGVGSGSSANEVAAGSRVRVENIRQAGVPVEA